MNCLTTRKRGLTAGRGRGFSILELVIAMALIGMIVLAVYGALTSGMGTIRMARENLRATQILLDKMEAIIANYDVNSPGTNSGILYYGTVEINNANTGTTYAGDMKQVTVRISWKTGPIARTREMSTYVCRTGIQSYIY
jgi:prepilin-type N-terminal cleavage/methylation domain-containing protein